MAAFVKLDSRHYTAANTSPAGKVQVLCDKANTLRDYGRIYDALVYATRIWNTIDNGIALLHGERKEVSYQPNSVDQKALWSLLQFNCPWAFRNENPNSMRFTYRDDKGTLPPGESSAMRMKAAEMDKREQEAADLIDMDKIHPGGTILGKSFVPGGRGTRDGHVMLIKLSGRHSELMSAEFVTCFLCKGDPEWIYGHYFTDLIEATGDWALRVARGL